MDTTKIRKIGKGDKANTKLTVLSGLLVVLLLSIVGFALLGSWQLNQTKEKEEIVENFYQAKVDIVSSYNIWLHWLTYKDTDVQNIIQTSNTKVSRAETALVAASSNLELGKRDSNALANQLNNITGIINSIKEKQNGVAENLNNEYVIGFLDSYELLIGNMNNLDDLADNTQKSIYLLWGFSVVVLLFILVMLFCILKVSQDYRAFSGLNYASGKFRNSIRNLEREARGMRSKRDGSSFPAPYKKYSVNRESPAFNLTKRLNNIKDVYLVYFANLKKYMASIKDNSSGFSEHLESSKTSLDASHKKLQKNLLNVKEAYDLTQKNREKYSDMIDRAEENKKIIVEAIEILSKITGRNNVIRESVQDSSKKTKRVGESSQSISQAIDLITSVSKKIHVLALNTAIQASHASDNGSKFSTIAQEIERLAKNSSEAAKKVEASVSNIHDDAKAATVAMENTTREVVEGTRTFEKNADLLRQAKEISEGFSDLIEQLSVSETKQDLLMKEVYDDFYNMDELMSESMKAVEESIRNIDFVKRSIEDYEKLLKIVDQQ